MRPNSNTVGGKIFSSMWLIRTAMKEVDAMTHQLDKMISEMTLQADEFRNIEFWNRDYVEDSDRYLCTGLVTDYAIRAKKEKSNKDPKRGLAIFCQLYVEHEENNDDQLLLHEPLVHILFSNYGWWGPDDHIILSSEWIEKDEWSLLADGLWCSSNSYEKSWFFSIPLADLNTTHDLKRQIISPIKGLITDIDQLPSAEQAEQSIAKADKVIRYSIKQNAPQIVAPSRLATSY